MGPHSETRGRPYSEQTRLLIRDLNVLFVSSLTSSARPSGVRLRVHFPSGLER